MADPTQFGHDRLSHLLADRFLKVPRFQRSYSWDTSNVEEFLEDLASARRRKTGYFMGTVVFAADSDEGQRQQIVDGQQRLTTTAILLIAARDLLKQYGKGQQAQHIDDVYLRSFDPYSEETVERLVPSPADQQSYSGLLEGSFDPDSPDPLITCYKTCRNHLAKVAPKSGDYREILAIARQLSENVQLLVAVATDLPEAYVIFETLNDRGADLTTADLLKNYLFSQAGSYFTYIESVWNKISAALDDSTELVSFIKHEYASRNGRVTTRKLYRSIQESVGEGARNARKYVHGLERALSHYIALRDSEHAYWTKFDFDVRDSLLAFRRFQFESSTPLLLAALTTWPEIRAARLVNKVAGWSVRAQFGRKLGGGLSEEAFANAAAAVSGKKANNQNEVLDLLKNIVTSDQEFRRDFIQYGNISNSRAKYLLVMLERAYCSKTGEGTESIPDWNGRGTTIEHILPKSSVSHARREDLEQIKASVDKIGNLALLEKSINRNLGSKSFSEKAPLYARSAYRTTRKISESSTWDVASVADRTEELADLAIEAWPR